jgi:16S rRNA (cytosine967-C5)-methyltransferase
VTEPLLEIAQMVIRQSSRTRPADAVLRTVLKQERTLTPPSSRAVAAAVFAYFRWREWLGDFASLRDQIAAAVTKQLHYDGGEAMPEEDLRKRAVPAWTHDQVNWRSSWLRGLQETPRLWLRSRPGCREELAAELGDCRTSPVESLPCALAYSGARDLFQTEAFHRGDFELQDISSQAVGLLCDPRPGETWWDACAGEGGKLLHLSDLMENKGLIWASDRAEWRLQRLRRRAGRAKVFNYRVAPWDGGAKLPTRTRFDGILVDAPCSGLGTWQRNPHARWTTTPEDVRELSSMQVSLLTHVAEALKPGGKLIYAVCTLTQAETTDVTAQIQACCGELEPCLLPNPFAPASEPAPELWLGPEQGGNGMFVAGWKAKGPG